MGGSLLRRRRRARRWLLADPREVVAVSRRDGGSGAAAPSELEPALARLRRRIQGSRLTVLLRRHLTVALALAIVLEALALLGVVPQLVVVVAPLVLLAATVAWALQRRPSLSAVAQLLDERLGLYDQLGTALELERRGAGNGGGTELERRTVAGAATLVEGAGSWRSRAVDAPREWAAAGAALAVLAVLVAVAVVPGPGSDADGREAIARAGSEGPTAAGGSNKKALEQYLGAKSGPARIKPGQVAPSEIRPATSGNREPGKATGKRTDGESYVTPAQGDPTLAQSRFEFQDQSLNGQPHRSLQGNGAQSGGHTAKTGEEGGGEQAGAGGDGSHSESGSGPSSQGSGAGKQGGGQSPSQSPNGSATGAGAQPGNPPPAPASKDAVPPKNGEVAAGSPGASTPGPSTAGNGVGGNRTGHSQGLKGTESKGLKVQAGYAPYHSAKAAQGGGRSGEREGAGGKAQTGAAESEGSFGEGAFAFVPATGGAVAGSGGSQLAQNYSAALGLLEELPW